MEEWVYPIGLHKKVECELDNVFQNPRATLGEMRTILACIGVVSKESSKAVMSALLKSSLLEVVPKSYLGDVWVGKDPNNPTMVALHANDCDLGHLFDTSEKGLLEQLIDLKEENDDLESRNKKLAEENARFKDERDKYAESFAEQYQRSEKLVRTSKNREEMARRTYENAIRCLEPLLGRKVKR